MLQALIRLVISPILAAGLPMSAWANSATLTTVNDSWYTIQVGSTPYGYFHEIIEKSEGRYSYRYQMERLEQGGVVYEENIGAQAADDLTPIGLNLNKAGQGTTESVDLSYARDKYGGIFNVQVSGAKRSASPAHVDKDTILDVFFPIWLSKNWKKFKPGYKGWVKTFAENPLENKFRQQTVKFEVKGMNPKDHCLGFKVQTDRGPIDWCMKEQGQLIDTVIVDPSSGKSFHVRRVESEQDVKKFIPTLFQKMKTN